MIDELKKCDFYYDLIVFKLLRAYIDDQKNINFLYPISYKNEKR